MLDPTKISPDVLAPVARVVECLGQEVPSLPSEQIMLIGAHCRDALHDALGHRFPVRATGDVDLALAISEWGTFEAIRGRFPRSGSSGVRFAIAGLEVDLLPFGAIEDPTGTSSPPDPAEPVSVWALEEIYAGSLTLLLPEPIRLPTVAGYTAAKLGAWVDRSDPRDLNDLALTLFWHAHSSEVDDELWEHWEAVLAAYDFDVEIASAYLLGRRVAELIGPVRCRELIDRWDPSIPGLARSLSVGVPQPWPRQGRVRPLLGALASGWAAAASARRA
jgi:predicted nucleotidyltransferase